MVAGVIQRAPSERTLRNSARLVSHYRRASRILFHDHSPSFLMQKLYCTDGLFLPPMMVGKQMSCERPFASQNFKVSAAQPSLHKWTGNKQIMENGAGIQQANCTQGIVVVKQPLANISGQSRDGGIDAVGGLQLRACPPSIQGLRITDNVSLAAVVSIMEHARSVSADFY